MCVVQATMHARLWRAVRLACKDHGQYHRPVQQAVCRQHRIQYSVPYTAGPYHRAQTLTAWMPTTPVELTPVSGSTMTS